MGSDNRGFEVQRDDRIVTVTLNRAAQLNLLDERLMEDLVTELSSFDDDKNIGCFVLKGSGGVFSAGGNIIEMESETLESMRSRDALSVSHRFLSVKTPKIASVEGLALGGGCELAMLCDIIVAGRSAKFGLPEVKLGIMPGMGGTQRMTKAIGLPRAMDLILTGKCISADEAASIGLISRVVEDNQLESVTDEIASSIGALGRTAAISAREAVLQACELPLQQGLVFERRAFHSLFGTRDQTEGMSAFKEKRKPRFNRE